jgi:Rhodopirellula transposase DDE domain
LNIVLKPPITLSLSQISDLRLAAKKMTGADRRSFQAEMSIKYCAGNARETERLFGWGRVNVELGLNERRTGMTCIGAQSGYSGAKLWEEKYPEAASALIMLAEAHCQQDPTFKSTIAYTRLTAKEALVQLQRQGFETVLPSPSSMAMILDRMGYRLRKVIKAKPKKTA